MTRPGAHAPCPASQRPLLSAPPPPVARLRALPGRRRRPCLSAVWAPDQPAFLRRAVHSWSGYGTLVEGEETLHFYPPPLPPPTPSPPPSLKETALGPPETLTPTPAAIPALAADSVTSEEDDAAAEDDGETVADSAALLEPRARRTGTVLPPAHSLQPHIHRPISNTSNTSASTSNSTSTLFGMPGIKNLIGRRREAPSSPLMRRDSCSTVRLSASEATGGSTSSLAGGLRKCETVLALTGLGAMLRPAAVSSGTTHHHHHTSLSAAEPVQAVNRLRVSPGALRGSSSRVCSRCSSLLSLAATSGSRYSLNTAGAGFAPISGIEQSTPPPPHMVCKLCLADRPLTDTFPIQHCSCAFCKECMKAYVEFEINEGAYDISCPDAQCPAQGVLHMDEVERLVGPRLLEKHRKYRLNREVDLDANRVWCPRAGCETVCKLCPAERCAPQSVHCPTCTSDFCSNCKLTWHAGFTCDENAKQLAKEGKVEEPGIPFDSDLIKCCPMCNVPIEKDEGCAQMMCKRCKHVFCWYCLTSLDDDFLLRHYDKGPCKNKLGHSRASVIWHRTQVIGIFAGFGILLLVASPLLLLAAPCIVCCKCRVCNAGPKLENDDELHDEATS